jgi:hypothetical protein
LYNVFMETNNTPAATITDIDADSPVTYVTFITQYGVTITIGNNNDDTFTVLYPNADWTTFTAAELAGTFADYPNVRIALQSAWNG